MSVSRGNWHMDRLETAACVVLALTVATRTMVAVGQPCPAWADSLHHSLITKLTVQHGALPNTLDPYFPIDLRQYHLGVYSLTATFAMLSGLPAHTAVLWMTQTFNALAGLGIYVVADRWLSRGGAVIALVAVGLVWTQPAVYFNLGRLTQLSANFLVLFAWAATLEFVRASTDSQPGRVSRQTIKYSTVAGLLCGAVCLLHFRAAIILTLLIAPTLVGHCWQAVRHGHARFAVAGSTLALFTAVALSWPALRDAYAWHVVPRVVSLWTTLRGGTVQLPTSYAYARLISGASLAIWRGPWSSIAIGGLLTLRHYSRIGLAMLTWLGLTTVFLAIEALHGAMDVVNPGFVLLMLYLPGGMLLAVAATNLVTPGFFASRWACTGILAVSVALLPRTLDVVEPFRFFVTARDLPAMEWIRTHTRTDAVFAINTTFWVPGIPHGTDDGYWIPYFADRGTTTGCLLPGRFSHYAQLSTDVVALANGEDRIAALAAHGVTHVYLGRRGNYDGHAFDAAELRTRPDMHVVYDHAGVTILEITTAQRSR